MSFLLFVSAKQEMNFWWFDLSVGLTFINRNVLKGTILHNGASRDFLLEIIPDKKSILMTYENVFLKH